MKLSKCLVSSVVLLLFLVVGVDALSASQAKSGSSASQAKSGSSASQAKSGFRSKSGFRGLKWGAPRSEHEFALPSQFRVNSAKTYFREYINYSGKHELEDVRLSFVLNSFAVVNGVEKFESAKLMIEPKYGKDIIIEDRVVEILTKQYGACKKYEKVRTAIFGGDVRVRVYEFEDNYVKVYFTTLASEIDHAEIVINSKEMRSKFPEIWEKHEKEKKQKQSNF